MCARVPHSLHPIHSKRQKAWAKHATSKYEPIYSGLIARYIDETRISNTYSGNLIRRFLTRYETAPVVEPRQTRLGGGWKLGNDNRKLNASSFD